MILARKDVTNDELEKILDYWKTTYLESNDDVLDSVRRYEVNLRIPIEFRGPQTFRQLRCRLTKQKNIQGYLLNLELQNLNSIFAPFLVGFVLGTLVFVLFIPLVHCLVIGLIMSFIVGSFFNLALWTKAPRIAREFLNELLIKAEQHN